MSSGDPFTLSGKVALITGGSRGLGLAIAKEFAAAGAAGVVIASRNEERLARAVSEVAETGVRCLGVPGDVTIEDDVDEIVRRSVAEFERLDIVVNNAGGATFKSTVKDMKPEGWRKMIDLNLYSTFLVSRAVLECWEHDPRSGRSILNIGSTASLRAFPELAYYSASKHGLVGLTKTLAREVARSGVRVNVLCPHLLETELTATYRSHPNFEQFVDDIPMQRWGEVAEIARVARFLASDAASYVTGAVLAVDGGWSS